MIPKSRPKSIAFLGVVLSTLALFAVGCGSSKTTTTTTARSTSPSTSSAAAHTTTLPTATAAPTTAVSTTAAPTTAGLSGTWAGNYSGAYTGTFTVTWQQSGSSLTGTIMISSFNNSPTNITGTVNGDTIEFGTVGSQAIQYSGTISNASMSGTWHLAATSTPGGSWTATKTA